MIPLKLILAIVSAIVGTISFLPYIRDIFLKKTKPHSYSWLIWTILQATGVVAMLSGGAGLGVVALSVGVAFCGFIFLLSLRYGTKNITRFDTLCFIGALLATGFYVFLNDALLSVVLVTFIDFVAFLPTLRKAYEEPYTETFSTFLLSGIANLLALGALDVFSVTTALYPASLVITNSICSSIILLGKNKKTRRKNVPKRKR
ncbi:Uncharacterised protein [uncultured archaeon]|nr:Uncharacterised protein [uncultured archaeon]